MLYLVGTPIGNLDDISPRACEILRSVDVIACEDTRVTGILLSSLGITGKRLIAYHEHNKAASGNGILDMLKSGLTVAQVSDAGMPAISDPGADLASLASANDIEVSVIPGPSAVTAALSVSGLDTRYFHFEGFLPSEGSSRRTRLKALTLIGETIVLYEAPHRLRKLLDELVDTGFGDRRIALCRELTKRYEEVLRMTVNESVEYYKANEPRGEFCLCLEPLEQKKCVGGDGAGDPMKLIELLKEKGMSSKDISVVVSEYTGMNKKEAYKAASEM